MHLHSYKDAIGCQIVVFRVDKASCLGRQAIKACLRATLQNTRGINVSIQTSDSGI